MENTIKKFIKDGEKTTTEIANHIKRNHYSTLNILEELKEKKIIEKNKMGKFTFWRLLK